MKKSGCFPVPMFSLQKSQPTETMMAFLDRGDLALGGLALAFGAAYLPQDEHPGELAMEFGCSANLP